MLTEIIKIAQDAGDAILQVYNQPVEVEIKSDNSPLTLADKKSNEIILAGLNKFFPTIPVISEETKLTEYAVRKEWTTCFIVDPLDGTKEFIKRNGEFTVNIALVQDGIPVLGVIYLPAKKITYMAEQGIGSFKIENNIKTKLSARETAEDGVLKIVGSRSHQTPELLEYVETQKQEYKEVEFVAAGSSLKFCLIAEGKADVYPRLGPTMEWDTCAGQIIATEAGAITQVYGSTKIMTYNREDLLNPYFIVKHASFS